MIELLAILRIATLASSAALLVVLLLRKPVRRYFLPHVAYAIWIFVPAALVAALLPAPVKVVSIQTARAALAADQPHTIVPTPSVGMPLAPTFDPVPWLADAWLTGAGFTLLVFLRQQRRFVRNLGHLSRLAGTILRAQTVVGSPALLGTVSPRIVVPVDFEQRYSHGEQRLILAHERHHRARGDAQINALCMLLRCVFWFNPLIHIAAAYFRLDQELACDAAVIARFGGARRSYASALLKTQLAPTHLPMGCYWLHGNALKERILLLQQPIASRTRRGLGAVVAMLLIGAGTYAAWAMQPPRIQLLSTAASGKPAPKKVFESIAARAQVRANHSPGIVAQKDLSTSHRGAHDTGQPIDTSRAIGNATRAAPATTNRDDTDFRQADPSAWQMDPFVGSQLRMQSAPPGNDIDVAVANRASEQNPSYRATRPPSYPAKAIREHIQGRVVLRVRVDEYGQPIGVQVVSLNPATATILADSSIAAVMQWRFNPALRDGTPVAGTAVVPFNFQIRGPKDTRSTGEIVYVNSMQMRLASYRLVRQVEYPPDQAPASAQGPAQVKARIDADGSITSASVDGVEPSSAQVLAAAALTGAKPWTFNPTRNAGKDIASVATVPAVFVLRLGSHVASMDGNASGALDPTRSSARLT